MRRFPVGVLALFCFCWPAWAGDIAVTRAMVAAPPSPNAATIAAYFTIENAGPAADHLTAITTPAATGAMLHQNIDENGVMKMLMLEKIEIPAGGKVEMKPAGLHVMLMGPTAAMRVGDEITFQMSFEKSGPLQVKAKVVPLSAVLAP